MHFFTFTYNNEKQFLQMQIFFFLFHTFSFFAKNNWEKKRKAVEVTSNGTHTYYT